MKLRAFAGVALLSACAATAGAQIESAPKFLAADVHTSAPQRYPFFQQMPIFADHYILKGGSMAELIAAAYGVDITAVQGGPAWLENERFDITALTPPKTSKDALKPMLQALLAERFGLVVHTGSKPMPAYVLGVTKDKPKLKPAADPDAPSRCEYKGTPTVIAFECHNTAMASFADQIHQWAGDYLKLPVADETGLKGGWDFDIKWTGRDQLAAAGPDAIPIFAAVEKQLGLTLEQQTAPRTVTIVDKVNERPTPNPPALDKMLPPVPIVSLEVATIKPATPGQHEMFRITPDSMNLQHATIRQLMNVAWDLNGEDKEVPVNAPKWLDQDAYDIVAKLGAEPAGGTAPPLIPIIEFRRILRELLAERFALKTHMQELPMNGYKLVAVNPKMKPADPASRTHCVEGPGPDGKDPRIANPVLARLVTCQNVTMAQFGEELVRYADGYVFAPVLDATGLPGGWDFTLSFSRTQELNAGAGPETSGGGGAGAPSTPNGALSLFDAMVRQLGVKLERDRRLMPVLVIDNINEKPTAN